MHTLIDVIDDSKARELVVIALFPFTEYEFVIHITNLDHQGPDSKRTLATTNGVGKYMIIK